MPSKNLPIMTLRRQDHTTSYAGIATVARTTPSNQQNIHQTISWTLSGGAKIDSPPTLDGRGTTVSSLKPYCQENQIKNVAIYEQQDEAPHNPS